MFARPQPAENNSSLTGEFWTGLQESSQERSEDRAENVDRYKIAVTDDEYSILNQSIANAEIPEDEAHNWATALQYSRNFGTPLDETYANLESINEYWLGPSRGSPKSNFKAVTDSFILGKNTLELGDLGGKLAEAESTGNEEMVSLLQRRIDEVNTDNSALGDSQPRPWTIDALKFGAQSAPFTGYVIGAGLIGSVLTPFVGTATSFGASMKQQQGLEYLRLREQGVDQKYAQWISTASGGLQAVVEVALGNVSGNLSKVTGANTITSSVLKRLTAKGTFGKIGKILMAYGTEALEEGFEEAIQELIGAGASALAAELQGQGVETDTAGEVARSTMESFRGGFLGSLVLGISGTSLNARTEFKHAAVLKEQAESIGSKEAFIKESAESVAFEGMTESDRVEAQESIWQAAANKREDRINADAADIAEMTDEGFESDITDEQGADAEASPMVAGEPVRLNTGRLHVQEGTNVIQNEDGSVTRVLKAGDPTRETKTNRYGYIKFREYENHVVVDDFRMGSGYRDIQGEFFQDFSERVAGKEIEWEPTGTRSQALKQTLINANPSGSNAGLQYFSKETDPGNIRGRLVHDQQIAKYFPKMDSTERATAIALLETHAEVKGMDLEQFLDSSFQKGVFAQAGTVIPDAAQATGLEPGKVKGGVSFSNDVTGSVKALIYVTENSDFSTYVHEMAHVFRKGMDGDLLTEAETAFGVQEGNWTRENEEKFAVGFEEYLREGKAPTEGLTSLFKKMAEFLQKIYNALANRVEVSPEIRRVYDQLLAGDGPLSEIAREQVETANQATAAKAAQTETAKETKTTQIEKKDTSDETGISFKEKARKVIDEAGEAYKNIPDDLFFQSEKVKKLLEHMTRDELVEMLHSSDSADGLPNYRAYRRDVAMNGAWPVQASLDADSLKWVNDNMGHATGDLMLKEIGGNLKAASEGMEILVYHKSGDEFLVQAKTVNEYIKFKSKLDNLLKDVILTVRDEEFGGEIIKPGIFISDGIDNKGDINAADKNLGPEKSYKENHGERAGRGEVPPGTRIVHDTGRVSDNRAARLLFRAREKNLEKRLKKENKTPANQFTPTRTRELRKIIDEGGDILFQYAYHGTPHSVERFSTNHIGSGEGNQSYGWGLYFAGNKDVADWYRQKLSQRNYNSLTEELSDIQVDGIPLINKYPDLVGALDGIFSERVRLATKPEGVINHLEKLATRFNELSNDETYPFRDYAARITASAQGLVNELKEGAKIDFPAGHLYKVDIPEHEDFLDWDSPWKDQGKKIVGALEKEAALYRDSEGVNGAYITSTGTSGEQVYQELSRVYGGDKAASVYLNSLGIPGICYLDGNSRGKSSGSFNYVIFDDSEVKIEEMLFQTEEEIVTDAASFDSWQDFMEFYEESSWTRPDDAAVPENADAQWYQSVWEKSKGITTEESLNEGEVAARVELDNQTPGGPEVTDALWSVEMRKPGKLEEFLKQINWILTQKDTFAPADEGELASVENIDRMKRRITVELRHGSWISNATRLGVGRELTEKARRTLLTLMGNAPRDYRALYSDIMEASEWQVSLADTEAGRLASITDPEIDYTEMSPEQRRKIAEHIDNAEIAEKLKTGELTTEEAERHIKYLNSLLKDKQKEIQGLEKEEQAFRDEVGSDYRRISDWETRRLLELKDELDMARAKHESRSDKTSRMIEKGQAITQKYQFQSQQFKANYDTIFRKFSDLSRAMEISGAVKTAIARRESLFEARSESARLQSQINVNREARKIRTQLVKKTMRRVRFENVNYEEARKVIAIQRKFSGALYKGLNKWLGTQGPYLREVYSRWKTDEDYRNKLSYQFEKSHPRKWKKMSELLEKDFDTWTNSEREKALDFFPKEDWIEELELDKLTQEREESLQMDETSTEFQKIIADALPARVIARIEKRPFAEWTIEEMEELAAVVDKLYSDGRRTLIAKKEAVREDAFRVRNKIKNAILDPGYREGDTPEDKKRKDEILQKKLGYGLHVKGTLADTLERKSLRARLMNKGYIDANVRRVARFLDGGKEGVNTDLLYHQEDLCYNVENRIIRERNAAISQAMESNGVAMEELFKTVEFADLMETGRTESFTVDELLFILKANDDEQSQRAVMFGNFLSDTEKETWGTSQAAEEMLENFARPRYEAVLSAAQALPQKILAFADVISDDYTSQYERMNEASIAEFNKPVWRVNNYVPLIRLESGGDTNENRVAEDLLGMSSSRKQTGAEKGMTQKRINISAAYQRPVQLGLYTTWVDSVKRTEHFIAYAPYVRELNRIYKGLDAGNIRGWIRTKHGDGMLKYIDQYINEVANPDAIGEQSGVDRVIRTIRGRTAPAYLAWKMSGILKQFATSPAPYFAHVTPAEYAAAAFDFARHYSSLSDSVREKSVFMDSRVMDPLIDLIREQQSKTGNKAASAWDQFTTRGMQGLEFADWACVAPGWLAVYRKTIGDLETTNKTAFQTEYARLQATNEKGLVEEMKTEAEMKTLAEKKVLDSGEIEFRAIKAADDITRLCQPSSRITDLAPLFKERGKGTEALKILTQFQTSLNVIWQNIRYDLPQAVREKQWSTVIGTVGGYVAAGIAVNMLTEGFSGGDDDDPESKARDFMYYGMTQFTEAVPLVGDAVSALAKKAITGSSSSAMGEDFYPALSKIFQAGTAIATGDWEKSAKRTAEGIGYIFGAPVSGLKEVGRAFGIGDKDGALNIKPEALLGRRK